MSKDHITFECTITKTYSSEDYGEEDTFSLSDAEEMFINDIANSNFKIEIEEK